MFTHVFYLCVSTMLHFHRETRNADTEDKYLELVEILYNPSLIPRLSCTPGFINAVCNECWECENQE